MAANYKTAMCHLHTMLVCVSDELVENWSDFEESNLSSEDSD